MGGFFLCFGGFMGKILRTCLCFTVTGVCGGRNVDIRGNNDRFSDP